MCGIVAVVRRPPEGVPPELAPLLVELDAVVVRLTDDGADRDARVLQAAAAAVQSVARTLRGPLGAGALIADPVGAAAFEHRATEIGERLLTIEARLDSAAGDETEDADDIEARNAALGECKDAVWALQWDRLAAARAIEDLAGRSPLGLGALGGYHSMQVALSALDRLEVRGRDSAGLHVLVADHGLDLGDADVARLIAARAADRLFTSGSVRVADGNLAFVYKTAAEIGELGDNTARLRAQIRADELLRIALRSDTARVAVLSHTRWASVGIISEANAHPLNQEELGAVVRAGDANPYVVAALNGDVDNYADLKALESLTLPPEITTDAKVIPALVARRIASGVETAEAFRSTVASFEGSVAIGAMAGSDPDRILLALRGSGQALYVGLGDDCFVVASEPYGVVEECDRYFRLDGETMLEAANPASQGQVVVVDARQAGTIAGVTRQSYDGRALPVADFELQTPEITTRDVARGNAAHYLLKEMAEAPASFRKTLRGRIVERDGRLEVRLPAETLPAAVLDRLRSGTVRRVLAIGQGSAHIAGQSFARVLRDVVGVRAITIEALTATELSGFELTADMRDTVVVAISQSGTTTDTNRTVDLARARGAVVVAIVNRRQSDLVDKSDGVLYTSDGRDVEMSVASTKAFYAQLAAGHLLALGLAAHLGADDETGGNDVADRARHSELLAALRDLPSAMQEVFARRSAIAQVAQRHALSRRSWAVVGNGVNRIAAHELRIKLSELCYKSIACDVTEDKKHIDLSSEPMIVVCAAGLHGSNADDVAKEVAIYRAHKAVPIVIADDDETRFESAAAETIPVPSVHPSLAFVLCALAGHLFGYEAALAIDASARPLREARGHIEALVGATAVLDRDPLAALVTDLEPLADRFFDGLRAGNYDGSLEARTAVQLASMLRYAVGVIPLDAYQVDFGKVGTPSVVVEDLTAALTKAIEELTRPVDAIKHQAKTVTVGISRSDETLLQVPLVREVLATGAARDSLTYRALRTLVALDGAVDSVIGWTRYRIEGDPARGASTVQVVDRGGIARDIPSRTADNPVLRGTKHRVATEREVTVGRGRADDRTLIFVPEVKGTQATGITLLHVRFLDRLDADAARRVLEGYRDRYQAIADQVTEIEPVMRDDVLGRIGLVELLTEPVVRLADYWKH